MTGLPGPPTTSATELHLRNDLAALAHLHTAVEAFGRQWGLPNRVLFELNLALDEWVTNIVAYGYDDNAVHTIVVRLRLDTNPAGSVVAIEIEDDARPFNPLEVPPPRLDVPLEDRAIGGLGIHFVRRCMDDVAYERVGGRNRLLLRKRVVG